MRNFTAFVGCVLTLSAISAVWGQDRPAALPVFETEPFAVKEQPGKKLKLLFFGDKSGHAPEARFRQLEPAMAKRGIEIVFTGTVNSINAKNLANYDGLILYTNTTKISPEQEKDLIAYVEDGKALIPLHCASYAFQNSPKYIAMVGAQFKSHGTGVFKTTIAEPNHPIMKGFEGFESWDETYVHTKHNEKDRIVLEYRVDGKVKEPWTWVRTQGKGRVFYTAWGHDQRTWSNPGFLDLVERGIRWAVGETAIAQPTAPKSAFDRAFKTPEMTPLRKDVAAFQYQDVGNQIPNYKGGKAKTLNQQQVPLRPEESIKHMVVPQGFKVELIASDPLIHRPICMNWDEKGRLWVAESPDYPHTMQNSGNGKGQDRLIILEDTKGTGVMDKYTVFADKLSIPAGFTFSNGGVIVFEGKKTVFLKDTKGTGKADLRKEMFGTWGQGDTHGGVSNMRYGLDNWIWAMQGYNKSTVIVGGEKSSFSQGFFRFKPDGSKLEFLRSTNNNTWGLGISEEGLIFGSTANANPSVHMTIPNRYYESVKGWGVKGLEQNQIAGNPTFAPITDKVRQVDQFGRYTAAAGHSLYTARNYPEEYWNRIAFVNEPTGHLVGAFVIRRDGAQFKSSNPFNLVASNDEWTSPILSEVGPDGNVWFIDWYSYIIQHNPTPPGFKTGVGAAYSTDLRKTDYGRIYRVVPANQKPQPKMTLENATPEKLVATLKNDTMFWRLHAQRLLVERGKQDVVPELIKLVNDTSVDAIGLNTGAIHALWTLHGLGALKDATNNPAATAAYAALKHPSPGVRLNAAKVLPLTPAQSVQAILDAGLLDDPDPHTRLTALLALADQAASAKAGEAIAAALGKIPAPAGGAAAGGKGGGKKGGGGDENKLLRDAATAAAAKNSQFFLMAVAGMKKTAGSIDATSPIVANHYARGGPVDSIKAVIAKLADAEPAVADPIIRGLVAGWPKGKTPKLDAQFEKDLARLVARNSGSNVAQLATTLGSTKFGKAVAEAAAALLAKVKNESAPSAERVDAARELMAQKAKDKATVKELLDLLTPRTPTEVATGILGALKQSELPETGQMILDQMPTLTPAVRTAGIGVLLTRAEWTKLYLAGVQGGKLQLGELSLDQKQALAAHPNMDIRKTALALLKTGGALPNADREEVIKSMLEVTKTKGDPAAGKLVFTNTCNKCHIHSGVGTGIGPDLTGMAVHTKEHLLVEILDPSRSVEGNFRVYTVVTTKGVILSGLLAGESSTQVELIDAEAKRHVVFRDEIESLTVSTKSLMPDGFEKQLSKKDFTDLLEFLTLRGKFLVVPLEKAATVVTTKGMFYDEGADGERLVFKDWSPKTFDGVPFHFVDPHGDKTPNAIMLYSPQGAIPPKMPKSVNVTVNSTAVKIHLLSGVSGWGYPYAKKTSNTMIVRLHYQDGKTEDHMLKNGEHFADYISKKNDVKGSKFAFDMGNNRQLRYLAIAPKRTDAIIERIEFVKAEDNTAPIVMAMTIEGKD